jgi:hypothetical protein
MYRKSIFGVCGLAALGLVILPNLAGAQQKPASELIAGNWTLTIADNVHPDGTSTPGFGPLPSGTATFGTDGHYSLQIAPSSTNEKAEGYAPVRQRGTYTLDEAQKTLSLRIEEGSVPAWSGTVQTGKIKFLNGDDLGWNNSVPLTTASGFASTELIWRRAK